MSCAHVTVRCNIGNGEMLTLLCVSDIAVPNLTTDCVSVNVCMCTSAFGCEVWPSQQNTSFGNGQLDTTVSYGVYHCLAACYLNQSCTGVDWNASAPLNQGCWLSGHWSGPNITSPGVTHYDYNGTCLAQGNLLCGILYRHHSIAR